MSKIAEEYSAICEDDEEIRNDTFKETLKNRICNILAFAFIIYLNT